MKIKTKLIIPLLVILGFQIFGQSNRFEPKIINNVGPKYAAQAQKMKRVITSYNQFVYERKFKEATWVTEHYFPKSEIEYIAKHGHSIISEYHVNEEVQTVKFEPEIVPKKVTKVFENETDELYILTYENNTKIETTWSHPFFIVDKGWTEVKDIKIGDYSQTVDGKLKITKIDIRKLEKPIKVFNFEVEGNHNYFVSNYGILVHNQNKPDYGKPIKTEYITGGGGGGGPGLGIMIGQGIKSLYLTAGYYYGQASNAISNQVNRLFNRGGTSIVGETTAVETRAYLIAEEGGAHSGFLKTYKDKPLKEITKGIQSIQKQIDLHKNKIANPEKEIPNWSNLDPRQQQNLLNIKWPGDIQRQTEQKQILETLIERRRINE